MHKRKPAKIVTDINDLWNKILANKTSVCKTHTTKKKKLYFILATTISDYKW